MSKAETLKLIEWLALYLTSQHISSNQADALYEQYKEYKRYGEI